MQQTILASTSDAVVTTSLEGQIHYTNPAFDRLLPEPSDVRLFPRRPP